MGTEVLTGEEFGVFWGPDLYTQVIDKAPIVEDFLYTNDVICIAADAGVGKSLFALQLMCNLTTGLPFLGTYRIPKPCNVCYLQTEGDRGETVDRVRAMAQGIGIDNSRWCHINLAGICLNTTEGMTQLKAYMAKPTMPFDVLIIDPLYTTVKGSMSKDEVATDWIRNVREVKEMFKNCALVILHHLPKDNYVDGMLVPKTMFGSAMWKAYVNYSYSFSAKDGRHTLKLEKRRNDKVGFDHLEMKLLEPLPLRFVYADNDPSLAKTQVREMLKDAKGQRTARQIIDTTGLSKATVFRVVKILLQDGVIARTTDHNKQVGYEYRDGMLTHP